jgi:hypothetical protein
MIREKTFDGKRSNRRDVANLEAGAGINLALSLHKDRTSLLFTSLHFLIGGSVRLSPLEADLNKFNLGIPARAGSSPLLEGIMRLLTSLPHRCSRYVVQSQLHS